MQFKLKKKTKIMLLIKLSNFFEVFLSRRQTNTVLQYFFHRVNIIRIFIIASSIVFLFSSTTNNIGLVTF